MPAPPPVPVPEMAPLLVTVAVVAEMPEPKAVPVPEMVPTLVLVTVSLALEARQYRIGR